MTGRRTLRGWGGALLLAGLAFSLGLTESSAYAADKIYRVMPVGDSITEGGSSFASYRYPLWEMLHGDGYLIEYVGSRTSESRIGPLKHEGYSGKNAQYVGKVASESFRTNTADIVLIHAGHNHTSEEKPVGGIVAATEAMIESFRKTNPHVIVLLAQVIHSGKLPKYSYIPELDEELGKLAEKLNRPGQPVIAVDQAEGFYYTTDTIADKVHPNARGAEKMAAKWRAAMETALPPARETYKPKIEVYKEASGSQLALHIFAPRDAGERSARPAIVFFFGGGWKVGTPLQFYPECAHFADRGMVAISADYRIQELQHTTPFESVADGKSAIRWVRAHASELGIDPQRIVAAGASAGGQVAAATGIVPGLDEAGEGTAISSKPNALMLWYPVVDNGPDGYGYSEFKDRYREISPLHNVGPDAPPTLVFLGTKDKLIPVRTAEDFKARIEAGGGRCDLKLFPDSGHPIYSYRQGASPLRDEILADADAFLSSLGYLPHPLAAQTKAPASQTISR